MHPQSREEIAHPTAKFLTYQCAQVLGTVGLQEAGCDTGSASTRVFRPRLPSRCSK
jgi:hypothetical protein